MSRFVFLGHPLNHPHFPSSARLPCVAENVSFQPIQPVPNREGERPPRAVTGRSQRLKFPPSFLGCFVVQRSIRVNPCNPWSIPFRLQLCRSAISAAEFGPPRKFAEIAEIRAFHSGKKRKFVQICGKLRKTPEIFRTFSPRPMTFIKFFKKISGTRRHYAVPGGTTRNEPIGWGEESQPRNRGTKCFLASLLCCSTMPLRVWFLSLSSPFKVQSSGFKVFVLAPPKKTEPGSRRVQAGPGGSTRQFLPTRLAWVAPASRPKENTRAQARRRRK